jgi:hypothetical protein
VTDLNKRYEELLQLRAKVAPGEWSTRGRFVDVAAFLGMNTPSEAHAALIVAAVNFSDSLPALKKEWEREVRLDEAKWWGEHKGFGHTQFSHQPYTCDACRRLAALARED